MSGSHRVQRVERELQQVVARYLLSGFNEPLSGIATVSRVQITRDLRSAKVFLSFMGDNINIDSDIELIQGRSGDFGHEISKRLHMKFCPRLEFLLDKGLDHHLKIERILHEISEPS